ncbi:MAG: hypothetical protein ABI912_02320 [Actinomycetota bacterium]
MTKFMVIYNAGASAGDMMSSATPEEMKAGLDAWMAWSAEAGDALLDFGMPVQARSRITANGATDPATEASGYSMLEAASLDELTALLEKHPHLKTPDSSIDVLEVLPMPGM